MVRCLVASTDKGDREEVFFTEDFDSPAEEFFYMREGMKIRTDEKIVDLPAGFPLDYTLVRQ